MSRWSSLRSYHSIVAIDQGVSSLTNFIGVSMVARSVDADVFGTFSVLYLLSIGWLAASRGWLSSRVSLLPHNNEIVRQTASILAFTLLISIGILASLLLMGRIVGAPDWLSLSMGFFSLFAILQDELRFAAIALARPGAALASDLSWFVLWCAAWIAAGEALVAVAAFVLGPAVALVVLAMRVRIKPVLSEAWAYGRAKSTAATAQLLVAIWGVGGSLVVTLVLAVAYSSEDAAGIQAATSVMSPPLLFVSTTYIGVTPWLARQPRSRDFPTYIAIVMAGVLSVIGWFGLVWAVPEIGSVLVGDSWQAAGVFLVAVTAQRLAAAIQASANVVLRVRRRESAILSQVGVAVLIFAVCLSVALAQRADAVWIAWSLALAWLASAIVGSVVAVVDSRRAMPQI